MESSLLGFKLGGHLDVFATESEAYAPPKTDSNAATATYRGKGDLSEAIYRNMQFAMLRPVICRKHGSSKWWESKLANKLNSVQQLSSQLPNVEPQPQRTVFPGVNIVHKPLTKPDMYPSYTS